MKKRVMTAFKPLPADASELKAARDMPSEVLTASIVTAGTNVDAPDRIRYAMHDNPRMCE